MIHDGWCRFLVGRPRSPAPRTEAGGRGQALSPASRVLRGGRPDCPSPGLQGHTPTVLEAPSQTRPETVFSQLPGLAQALRTHTVTTPCQVECVDGQVSVQISCKHSCQGGQNSCLQTPPGIRQAPGPRAAGSEPSDPGRRSGCLCLSLSSRFPSNCYSFSSIPFSFFYLFHSVHRASLLACLHLPQPHPHIHAGQRQFYVSVYLGCRPGSKDNPGIAGKVFCSSN